VVTGTNALGAGAADQLTEFDISTLPQPWELPGGSDDGYGVGDFFEDVGPGLVTGYLNDQSVGDATDANLSGIQLAIDEQARQYDQTREDFEPWRNIGGQAINTLGSAYGYGPDGESLGTDTPDYSAFYKSPDYEFRRSEGLRDIGNQFSARGTSLSGNALRTLNQYNSDLAAGGFNDWKGTQLDLAGLGNSATSTGAQLGQYAANNTGNLLNQAGNQRASGVLGQGSMWNSVINNALDNYYTRRSA